MRLRTGLVGACAAIGMLMLAAPPVAADVPAAITSLSSANIYVDDSAGAVLDQSAASAALNSSIKIAVLPSTSGSPGALAKQIGEAIGGKVTVGVFVGKTFDAQSNALCAGRASALAEKAVADNLSQLKSDNDLTNTIKDFASLVNSAGDCNAGSTGATRSGSGTGSTHTGWVAIGILGLVGAGAVGGLIGWRRRRDKLSLADSRAALQPYYDRLASEVGTLQPGDNPVARQALADASERFTSAGSQLASATRPAQVQAARRSCLEGLQAARTARKALGLDPGPELPPIVELQAPQLSQPQQVNAGGQMIQGYPAYTPGAPYYFGGGGGYPGGWYSTPFWESLLIAEALSPGWGGGWGGGGYASGYDSGFDAGRDSTQQGGGDWTGGGGDWGGGGGGDWGGGGGDWGGGGDSGGGNW